MNRKILLSFLFGVWVAASSQAASREAQWKRVDEARQKGLPRTALEELEPILQQAVAEKAWAEAAKALTLKVSLQGTIQGGRTGERIVRLEAEILEASPPMVPILDTVLAHWYWQYFRENRWRFLQRTATAAPPGADFTTWDLPRLFAEIDRRFAKALAADTRLKAIPIAAYGILLNQGDLPDSYRPTLYDFIAHEALSFYTSGEQAAARPEDAFEASAESGIFAPAAQFIRWEPASPGADADSSPILKAIRLYQALLKFHEADTDPSAFLDADISRLLYAKNTAYGESKNARFKAALKPLAERFGDHDLASLAYYHRAQVLREEGDQVEARTVALRGQNAHPTSPGGRLCANLIAEIETPSATIATEAVWNAPWPVIHVRYRNVTNVWFRAVPWDWTYFHSQRYGRPGQLSEAERQKLLRQTPVHAWSHALAPTTDYKPHTVDLPAPDNLKPGYYFLVASHNEAFGDKENQVSMTDLWVSDLALVVRPRAGRIEGFVLEATSGEPVTGALVEAWSWNEQGALRSEPATRSDSDGFFSAVQKEGRSYWLRAGHQGRQVGSRQDHRAGWGEPREPGPATQTLFFTDRAIYRPGQAVQYKGICLRVDRSKDDYQTLAGQRLTVTFTDANGKEIARQQHQASDYGSFAGSFITPRDRLLGVMNIRVAEGPEGGAWVTVEEYKRPKFQVTLDAPKTAAKLAERVSLSGHALGYTGAAVDGAVVEYRVAREVRMPWWWGGYGRRWGGARRQASQEISHGRVRTQADGSFKIEFTAKPDLSVPPKDEPTFTFSIHADVTDAAGETRSADRGIRLGYSALEAKLSAPAWQTDERPVEVSIRTTTLDDEPQSAEGTLRVYALRAPDQAQRPSLFGDDAGRLGAFEPDFDDAAEEDLRGADLSSPDHWALGQVLVERGFTTDKEGKAASSFSLPVGAYRVLLETLDRFGRKVTGRLPLQILHPAAEKLAIRVPHLLAMPSESVEPGEEFMALWGTGYDQGRAFVEIEHRRQIVQRYWTKAGLTQHQIKQAVSEAMRGGFTLHVTQVRENRAYLDSRRIDVPWSNKELIVKWEHFTSKLQPGQKETWTAVITPKVGEKTGKALAGAKLENRDDRPQTGQARKSVRPEMVAELYDASLDAFVRHGWLRSLEIFRHDHSDAHAYFCNGADTLQVFRGRWESRQAPVSMRYRAFPPELAGSLATFGRAFGASAGGRKVMLGGGIAPAPTAEVGGVVVQSEISRGAEVRSKGVVRNALVLADAAVPLASSEPPALGGGTGAQGPLGAVLNQVTARRNLNETAFFFPQLLADTDGTIRMTFTMPEALTEWKFLGFAHDPECRSGYLEGTTVTAKDLMVQPNPPRFLREGDTLEFTVKVSNQSEARRQGQVRLTLTDGFTEKSIDQLLGNRKPEQAFDIPAKESRSYSWRLQAPDGLSVVGFKAVAASDHFSDGEEGLFPVLPRRILVTESLLLPIRGPATKKFDFKRLAASGQSATLRHQSLTAQVVSQPAWYAVMALPYLMEFPHECTEQTFNRFYANTLARFIANTQPKVRRVFDQWKATPALDSPLEKNQDLKGVMLEETPWLRQAQAESQARKNVGLLFDDNRLEYETTKTLQKVAEAQLPDGAWPWFSGGGGNDYITLYITTGFGRLRRLGVDLNVTPALRSLDRLDDWIDRNYKDILAHSTKDENHLTPTIALYLYGRSFFLKDRPIPAARKEAVDYFLGQARKYWLQVGQRQSEGHLALALHRFGDAPAAQAIMKSLKERAVNDEELGMFWRDTELSWWWYRAPIETQAVMIEAFAEVANDAQAVEDCKVWLLKQKQTQDWKTTKATADAIYALLLRGRDLLSSDALVEVSLGGLNITPSIGGGKAPRRAASPSPSRSSRASSQDLSSSAAASGPEAGTGYYERRFSGTAVKPAMGQITVKKLDQGVAWGSVHWQYLEDMSQVTPYAGTPLKLHKTLFRKQNTSKGPVLEAVKGPLAVGDELVVRLELRVDRDLEYVHLKDQRGSGTEPVNVLSGHRYQDGLGYYESTRDTASHFFIDYLPKGAYVFEYSTRIVHRGLYQTGVAEIQCMYAPEFNSHSESLRLEVP